jgi:hypothetical protein
MFRATAGLAFRHIGVADTVRLHRQLSPVRFPPLSHGFLICQVYGGTYNARLARAGGKGGLEDHDGIDDCGPKVRGLDRLPTGSHPHC